MERFYQRTGLLSLALLSLASLAAPCAIAKDKNPEHDPDQIGNRDVGKGVNFAIPTRSGIATWARVSTSTRWSGRSVWANRWLRRRNAKPRWWTIPRSRNT